MSVSSPADDDRELHAFSGSTSRNLLDRVNAGDPAAWDRLVSLYAPLVYGWCRGWHLPEQEIADVFQDVFQAVATNVGAFRRERRDDTFRGWLRTIAHNKVHDHYRRLGREPAGAGGTDAQIRFANLAASSAGEDEESPGPGADPRNFRELLGMIECEFEARTWRAFWMTAVEGRSSQEVASELGMSPGAVRVAKSRVLRRLREELGEA
jgi:RNA polymerase sigma-70 factor (ECF subfamily)